MAAAAIASSPRYLVLRDLNKKLADPPPPITKGDGRDTVRPADPGCMQLFSFYRPSLVGGLYTIKASQEVQFGDIPKPVRDAQGNDIEDRHKSLLVKGGQKQTLLQQFEVIAPQYKINLADIHSTYPPQGHADQPSVLPHVVFSDPHLPWERKVIHAAPDPSVDVQRAPLLPWLAVFPFDSNGPNLELRLSPDQLTTINASMTPPLSADLLKQSATFSTSMTLSQYLSLPGQDGHLSNVRIPIVDDIQEEGDTQVEVIFMSRLLFQNLFNISASFDTPTFVVKRPDFESFKYCAHVRNVNTSGMANAGVQDDGLFSILHSKRTGPTDIKQNTAPRTQVVHLLSLEGVDKLKVADGVSARDTVPNGGMVAFVSLFSWTYLCQPPDSVNFVDSMRQIGDDLHSDKFSPYLGCPKSITDGLTQTLQDEMKTILDPDEIKLNRAKQKMSTRLQNGYSLVRHRTASGQETTALSRGALLPVRSQTPTTSWPYASHHGQDWQILDPELGLMDISYSAAWQLGKTMAISDLAFVAALLRVRSDAYKTGAVASKTFTATQIAGFKTKATLLANMKTTLARVDAMTASRGQSGPVADLHERWKMNGLERGQFLESKKSSTIVPAAKTVFRTAVTTHLTVVGGNAGTAGSKPFDEVSPPEDVDWAFIESWILDRMYLYNLPAHYLVPEPSFLPPECMRFFHIDQTWMECLIDGALSVANHMDKADDSIRDGIKRCLNKYFSTKFTRKDDSGNETSYHYPQVPVYGFFLRSAVVDAFPDLVVEVPYPETAAEKTAREAADPSGRDTSQPAGAGTTTTSPNTPTPTVTASKSPSVVQNGRTPILVQKHMGKGIMMVLLDRVPDDGEIGFIQLTQPAHQQRFSAGDFLDNTKIEFEFRNPMYPKDKEGRLFLHTVGSPKTFTNGGAVPLTPYDWSTRCLDMHEIGKLLFDPDVGVVPGEGPLTSAITGLELNDTMKYLQIMPPDSNPTTPPTGPNQKIYQLRVPVQPATILPANQPGPSNKRTMLRATSAATATSQSKAPSLSAPQNIVPITASASSINSGSRSAARPPSQTFEQETTPPASSSKPQKATQSSSISTPKKGTQSASTGIPKKGAQEAATTKQKQAVQSTSTSTPKQATKSSPTSTPKQATQSTSTSTPKTGTQSTSASKAKQVTPSTSASKPKQGAQSTSTSAGKQKAPSTSSSTPKKATQSTSNSAAKQETQSTLTSKPARSLLHTAVAGSAPWNSPGLHDTECYNLVVYPSTSNFPGPLVGNVADKRSFVKVDTPYNADLIFSLVRRFSPGANIKLRSIELYIPLGSDPKKRARIPLNDGTSLDGLEGLGLVKATPCGTRCRMLSNQRWVVHIDPLPGSEHILLRLIPRSLERSSFVASNVELTFRLDEVTLDGGDGSYVSQGPVVIRKREVFGVLSNVGPVQAGEQELWLDQGSTIKDVKVARQTGYVDPPDMWND